jgi:hypothetical protein
MDKQLANYFFAEASKAFAFVVADHSFAVPQFEVNDKINFTFVTFMGKNIAIECSLDEREGDIACIINRVIGGKKVETYLDTLDERDKHGVRVRVYLRKLLEQRGVRERLLTRSGGLELRDRIKVRLADFAQMLRKHGKDILDDSPSALTLDTAR